MTDTIDRNRRVRLNSIKSHMARLRGAAAALMWDYGGLLTEVHRDELWRDDGAATFDEWTKLHADMSDETAYKAIAIARHFTREMAERFGSEKLAATVDYLRVTKREEKPGDVLALSFRLPSSQGFRSVSFIDASYREIEQATGLVKKTRLAAAAAKKPKPEPHIRERALGLAAALSPAPKGAVRGDRVTVKKSRDGRTTLTFHGIPVDEIEQFIEALRAHLLAEGDED